VEGFDLLAYRYVGDAEELARRFIRAVKVPVIVAGSINSFERLDRVRELGPWGFTIGSAFFDERFIPGAPFREQIQKVTEYLASF
jgi:phosphoribosylformimino-5-aminoimidazole carboxamide ribonucleotide (ProFAR) isomerase